MDRPNSLESPKFWRPPGLKGVSSSPSLIRGVGDPEVEANEVVGVCAKSSWTTWLKYLVPGPEYLNDAGEKSLSP